MLVILYIIPWYVQASEKEMEKLLPDVHFSFQAENTASYVKNAWRHERNPPKMTIPYLYLHSGLVLMYHVWEYFY